MKAKTTASLAIAVGLFVAGSAVVIQAATPIDTFGTVIDQPGQYVLTADLAAGGALGPAITVLADDVHLDLDGHSIVGNGAITAGSNLGILVQGTAGEPRSRVFISNGSVSQFHFGVWLDQTTQSHVTQMTLTENLGGIGLNNSSDNHVKDNTAITTTLIFANSYGILSQRDCDRNVISHNQCSASGRVGQGLVLNGVNASVGCDDNQIDNNICNDNGLVGIWLIQFCTGNNVVNNTANGNRRSPNVTAFANAGIALGNPTFPAQPPISFPRGHRVLSNTALDNAIVAPRSWDVLDKTVLIGECGNLWRNNDFVQDNETGADAGPKSGCIR
ncbi:MAG: right-handed parallel beta-helix repeat-containing protein [Verrucomicrobia bacterium]|nr:right-handed parallel beta-helix repeat-containing protein [Verrucomicrobiota bacterium]